MKRLICEACGASGFIEKDGYRICEYCGSKYLIESKSTISLNDDIQNLLQKCKSEPWNARKYANLVLDIDPTNSEACNYL